MQCLEDLQQLMANSPTSLHLALPLSIDTHGIFETWDELPSCPSRDSGLVVIDKELTAVGGFEGYGCGTDKLYIFKLGAWVEKYPPMNTKRVHPAVVRTATGENVIVIGGTTFNYFEWAATVEVFQLNTRIWQCWTNLPQPLTLPSATICGNQLYVIGDYIEGYTCSLPALPSFGTLITPALITLSWKPLPPLPVTQATPATVSGQFVIFRGGSSVNSIHQLVEGQWVETSSIGCSRLGCLVAIRSPEEVIVVGGRGVVNSLIQTVNTVEKCTITK